jgi:hypothetical protein
LVITGFKAIHEIIPDWPIFATKKSDPVEPQSDILGRWPDILIIQYSYYALLLLSLLLLLYMHAVSYYSNHAFIDAEYVATVHQCNDLAQCVHLLSIMGEMTLSQWSSAKTDVTPPVHSHIASIN